MGNATGRREGGKAFWVRRVRVAGVVRVMLGCLLAVSAVACRRKAPGPEECIQLAYASYGVRTAEDLRAPGVKQRVDELVTECLLTPFDRELVECTLQGGAPRACQRAFLLRHEGLTQPGLLRDPRRRDRSFP